MTKSERTKQFIIEQSAEVINKKGVAGTSITDLMEVTRLAKGGIYGNFDNKDEICLAAFHYLSGRIGKGLDQAIAGDASARQKLYALLDYYEGLALSDKGGCPLLNFGMEADDTNPAMRHSVAKAVKNSQARISSVIEQGIKAGEFKKNLDASLTALRMFTMIEGAIFTSRVSKSDGPMKNIVQMLKKEIKSF
jgi:TetR/AcrR family transcriptional regulator, transcriptional repressor for nem operon